MLLSDPNGSTTLSREEEKKEKQQCVWHGKKDLSGGNAARGKEERQKVLRSSSCFWIEVALRVPQSEEVCLKYCMSVFLQNLNTVMHLLKKSIVTRDANSKLFNSLLVNRPDRSSNDDKRQFILGGQILQ